MLDKKHFYSLKALQIVSRLHIVLCFRNFYDKGISVVMYEKEVIFKVFAAILNDSEEVYQQVGGTIFNEKNNQFLKKRRLM
jgi:hypothetical protein